MRKIIWDKVGERFYETGVDRGVLYPKQPGIYDSGDGQVLDSEGNVIVGSSIYPKGVPWNGLISVSENPSGAEPSAQYADNIKYLNLMSAEEFGASVEAFTYPDEFAACDGSAEVAPGVSIGQQTRLGFGLCYRTTIGNDTEANDLGYKLHLIYGAMASPSEKGYNTINESPEAITFSWEVTTTPVFVEGFKPTASLTVDSTKADPTKLAALEDILYGTAGSTEPPVTAVEARLPLPEEVIALIGIAG